MTFPAIEAVGAVTVPAWALVLLTPAAPIAVVPVACWAVAVPAVTLPAAAAVGALISPAVALPAVTLAGDEAPSAEYMVVLACGAVKLVAVGA